MVRLDSPQAKMPVARSHARGQTSLEYLLLLAVVAVVVIASFSPGSLISKVHDSAQDYYNTVTSVIMGTNPKPINGGWCPVTGPSGSGPAVMYRSCECPAPAFGGAYCSGNGNCPSNATCNGAQVTFNNVIACGPCPTGQVCNSSGQCVPPVQCSQNSTYNPTTQQCEGNAGTIKNSSGPGYVYCTATSGGQCTASTDGKTCSVITCAVNMNCNTQTNACQCDAGAYYVGPGCAYCPQCQAYDAQQKKCVDASTTICPPSGNWFCNPNVSPSQECQCWLNYCWNGTTCAWTGHSCP